MLLHVFLFQILYVQYLVQRGCKICYINKATAINLSIVMKLNLFYIKQLIFNGTHLCGNFYLVELSRLSTQVQITI